MDSFTQLLRRESAVTSTSPSLRDQVHARFREVFGDPHATEGGGATWSLRPKSRLNGVHVHVTLTGGSGQLGVWVFDPYDRVNGVSQTLIFTASQIDAVIEHICLSAHFPSVPHCSSEPTPDEKPTASLTQPNDWSIPIPQRETEIQNRLRARFREVFGEPHHSMGHDDHWRLDDNPTLALNVLLNGSPEKPAVWIFEPQRGDDGVKSQLISSQDDIEAIIVAIQNRLKAPPPIRTA